MVRRNFLQVLQEKNVDLKREYQRLYELFYIQKAPDMQGICYTLKDFCEGNFLNVPFRGTCLSLEDFDDTYNYHFEKIPHDFDLNYLAIDFKKKDGFLKTNKISKELGLYRQNYCGCVYSIRS